MNYWNKLCTRWDKKQLLKMSSGFRILYLLVPLLIHYVAGDLVEVILWAILNVIFKDASDSVLVWATTNSATLQALIYGVGIIVSTLIVFKMAKNEITHVVDGEKPANLTVLRVFILIVVALVFSLGLNYVFMQMGLTSNSKIYNEVASSQYSVNFMVGLILYGILSPVAEEIIFRGIIYNRLKRIFPVLLSIVLSALLFGIFHGNMVQGIYATLMGLIIALFYEKYESFYAPLIIHIVANLGVYVLSYQVWK